jgi:WD40 repeat protein
LLGQQKSVSRALHSSSQIIVWGKDGKYQNLPSEGTLADFLAAPNGNSICHIGRIFGSGLSIQLFREGRSLWKKDITTVGIARGEMPYLAFSSDSNECLVAIPEGKFIRVNLRNGTPQPPVASLTSIDKSLVQSISVSQKLDFALFGLESGEWMVVRTKDGRQIVNESTETYLPAEMDKPVIAAQFNSKDNRIATINSDGVVRFSAFPVLDHQTELTLIQDGRINVVGRSSNGRFLAVINDCKRVSVLDLDEANVFASWILNEPDVGCAISIDNLGKQIAIGFESGSIAVFQQSKEEWTR